MRSDDEPCSLTRAQARAYDAHCMGTLGIPGILLMECAAHGVALEAMRMAEPGAGDPPLFVAVCGPGQNGGDGYAAARLLASYGMDACALMTDQPGPGTDAAAHAALAQRMGIVRTFPEGSAWAESLVRRRRTVVIDALYGTGLARPIEGLDAVRVMWIASMRERGAKVLAVDVPSGMDCDSGERLGSVAVEADVTVTMVAPKAGMANPRAARLTGHVRAVPIGGPVPSAVLTATQPSA